MAITGCTHRKVTTFVFVAGNEPAGLWACADCGHKFVPLNIAVEKDAERYRWLRAMDITHEYGITNGDMSECPTGADADTAIDAAMLAAPDVGAA